MIINIQSKVNYCCLRKHGDLNDLWFSVGAQDTLAVAAAFWAKRTPWYMIPLISIETTRDVSELRPSPLELIFICAPGIAGTALLVTGVSGSSNAMRFAGGGALWLLWLRSRSLSWWSFRSWRSRSSLLLISFSG